MTLIKIDLTTIRRNPAFIENFSNINFKSEFRFKTNALPQSFKVGENCEILSQEYLNGKPYITNGKLTHASLIEECLSGKYLGVIVEEIFNQGNSYVQQEPAHLFEYENVELKCVNCNSNVKFKDLKTIGDDWESDYSDKVCPVCENIKCCDFELEDIEHALGRLSENPLDLPDVDKCEDCGSLNIDVWSESLEGDKIRVKYKCRECEYDGEGK